MSPTLRPALGLPSLHDGLWRDRTELVGGQSCTDEQTLRKEGMSSRRLHPRRCDTRRPDSRSSEAELLASGAFTPELASPRERWPIHHQWPRRRERRELYVGQPGRGKDDWYPCRRAQQMRFNTSGAVCTSGISHSVGHTTAHPSQHDIDRDLKRTRTACYVPRDDASLTPLRVPGTRSPTMVEKEVATRAHVW